MATTVLEREVYSMGEAARLLGVTTQRLRGWVDGYNRGRTEYGPVIRPERTGNEAVTWGEFVEAGYLREYRVRGVSLQRMRRVVQALRGRFDLPYPLAHSRLVLFGHDVVLEVEEEVGLGRELSMLRAHDGQLVLAPKARDFFEKVEFAPAAHGLGGEALRMFPDKAVAPAVVIDPLRQFGSPVVRNTRTENLYELFRAGDSVASIARGYRLPVGAVEDAIRYEGSVNERREAA